MTDYTLTITEKQAQEISRACEILARLQMGQIDMALRELPLDKPLDYQQQLYIENYLESLYRQDGERYDSVAWDLYQVVRHRLAWDRAIAAGEVKPNGRRNWGTMMGVIYDEPLRMGGEPLAGIEKVEKEVPERLRITGSMTPWGKAEAMLDASRPVTGHYAPKPKRMPTYMEWMKRVVDEDSGGEQ